MYLLFQIGTINKLMYFSNCKICYKIFKIHGKIEEIECLAILFFLAFTSMKTRLTEYSFSKFEILIEIKMSYEFVEYSNFNPRK